MANQPKTAASTVSGANKTDRYQSFMVRMWRNDGCWRAAVIDPHSDSRKLFARGEELLEFIAKQMEE